MASHPNDDVKSQRSSINISELCKNNCGFYGSEHFLGYCSKCFNDHNSDRIQPNDSPSSRRLTGQYSREPSSILEENPKPTNEFKGPNTTRSSELQRRLMNLSTTTTQLQDDLVLGSPSQNRSVGVIQALEAQSPRRRLSVLDCPAPLLPARCLKHHEDLSDSTRPIQKNKKRCYKCNVKHGVLGFQCKCGYLFCDQHRYPHLHDCTNDYRGQQRAKLEALEKVVPDKIIRF